ncbi:hypothetical protein [Methylobacterium durans]|uniref:Uncharacterized protein n=1 Tax=Methylobacterium durans TaxID=2202825 RepID=A0A2U8WAH8_9HYPH|nr:hypothetical protein [Methylobacterium durans]AWN43154.1 hypothetical protein DK389_25000 [Methylobacterium durans]
MTPTERAALEDARAACLASAEAIAAVLAGAEPLAARPGRDPFVRLKVIASAWGITEGGVYKQLPRLRRENPEWV